MKKMKKMNPKIIKMNLNWNGDANDMIDKLIRNNIETVTCDMCGDKTDSCFESKNGKFHVCDVCAYQMHIALERERHGMSPYNLIYKTI